MGRQNYLLLLSFIGTNFHGWQIQPNLRTVQGTIKSALEQILQHEVKLIGCCRTDSGVHAREYVANFKTHKYMDTDTLLKALNSLLPDDIGVLEVKLVDETFNARYSVRAKTYVYRLWNSYRKDPFLQLYTWHFPYDIDLDAIEKALDLLRGCHDFSSFAKLEEDKKNTWIHLDAHMERKGELIELRFTASHFLRYMVRRIVGCLVHVGVGKINLENVMEFLEGKRVCPYTAKAQGLTLEKVYL